ncbi:hypothetical protein BCR44DRAFT_41522 [Catenaria anguillulae PL171]|uniref:Uncharacterized protein n=1 Tax=Catenaria anguillulae PL171 TaxID=765915 RepID=A0A1Y2GZJ1_9FUNG|nr:hypothetical protein BCR44DRAFT_41522 [Catenaria anguillulae PL171]
MKQAVEEVREVVDALQIESHDPNLVTSAYSGDKKDWAHIIMFNTVDEIVDGKAVPKVVMRKFLQMWVTHELQVTGPKLYLDMSRFFQAANCIALEYIRSRGTVAPDRGSPSCDCRVMRGEGSHRPPPAVGVPAQDSCIGQDVAVKHGPSKQEGCSLGRVG